MSSRLTQILLIVIAVSLAVAAITFVIDVVIRDTPADPFGVERVAIVEGPPSLQSLEWEVQHLERLVQRLISVNNTKWDVMTEIQQNVRAVGRRIDRVEAALDLKPLRR